MKEFKEGRFENIKFDEVAFPRYIKVKESIEQLMKIIDFEKVKTDGVDRVLSAFLQLIDENEEKTVEEKRVDVEDAIYNGNVFRHYFEEENKSKAVDILSNTALLNDEERLIYIINFYMPNDINFTSVYNGFKKDIEKIAEYYNLKDEETDRLIYARATEIAKFYDMYKSEKDRQNRFNETYVLAAMQDVIDEPNKENIDKAKDLLSGLTNLDLKSTLEQQLSELESMVVMESPIEELDTSLETGKQETVLVEDVQEEPEATSSEKIEVEENVKAELAEEIVDNKEETVEEPKELEIVLEENQVQDFSNQEGVKEEVMASLQNLVASAKENATKVEQLKLNLDIKDARIAGQHTKLEAKTQELENKETELQEKDRLLEESTVKIRTLEEELNLSKQGLAEAKTMIEAKDNEIATLNKGIHAYQEYLVQLQNVLSVAQTGMQANVETVETRKVR